MKKIKDKVCAAPECFILFTPWNSMAKACSPECALELVRAKSAAKAKADVKVKEKADRAQHRKDKERIKSRGDWLKEAQTAFNKFIRLRDHEQPCISCGTETPTGCWDCGHFLSVGGFPELRFEVKNAYRQCSSCNRGSERFFRKAGTVAKEYERRLRLREGDELVDWLKGPHEPKHYTIEDIKDIKKLYSKMAREQEKLNNV